MLQIARFATAVRWKMAGEFGAAGAEKARKDHKVSNKYAGGQLTDPGRWEVSGFVFVPRFEALGGYNARAYAYSSQVKGRIVAASVDGAKDKAQYTCSDGSCNFIQH